MEQFYLGIDIAKAQRDCAWRLPNGRLRSKAGLRNAPKGLAERAHGLDAHGVKQLHAGMETAGISWESVAERLSNAGDTVSVQIKSFAGACLARRKTDNGSSPGFAPNALPSRNRPPRGANRP